MYICSDSYGQQQLLACLLFLNACYIFIAYKCIYVYFFVSHADFPIEVLILPN